MKNDISTKKGQRAVYNIGVMWGIAVILYSQEVIQRSNIEEIRYVLF